MVTVTEPKGMLSIAIPRSIVTSRSVPMVFHNRSDVSPPEIAPGSALREAAGMAAGAAAKLAGGADSP